MMKRWTLRILLMLCLGVVSTVAVAWGLVGVQLSACTTDGANGYGAVAFAGLGSRRFVLGVAEPPHRPGNDAPTSLSGRIRQVELDVALLEELGPKLPRDREFQIDQTVISDLRAAFVDSFVWDDRRGWPCLAMNSRITEDFNRTSIEMHSTGIDLGSGPMMFSRPVLPLRPILPGFIINTLFYSGVWFGVFFGVSEGRRTIRKKRGRCIKCGYDLRGDFASGCPECGWGRGGGARDGDRNSSGQRAE